LVAQAVGLGKVLGLLGILTRLDLGLHGRVTLAGLREDGEGTGLGRGGQLLALLGSLLQKIQAQHLVKVGNQRQLGGIVGLGLEGIVDGGNGKGGIEIVAQRGNKLLLAGVEGGLIHFLAAVGVEGGDLGHQLAVGHHGVVQVFIGEDQVAPVVGLQAEEPVGQRVIALGLQEAHREELALGFGHLAGGGVEVVDMEPVVAPLVPQVALRLGDLVGVVGEGIVNAAAVEIQIFAQVLHGD